MYIRDLFNIEYRLSIVDYRFSSSVECTETCGAGGLLRFLKREIYKKNE
jgi:hypothetical protein